MKEMYVALDFANKTKFEDFMKIFENKPIAVKVGMSQFFMMGPDIVKELADKGHKIFLDLKVHDIPNTVYLAMTQLSKLPVDLLTVHTLGGKEMLEAAIKGAGEGSYQPKVLGITHLTSLSEETIKNELHMSLNLRESVKQLTLLAKESQLDGVVSSVQEVQKIKKLGGNDFLSLTPGIRLDSDNKGDQKRIATPRQAKLAGADYIVVGRPITQAKNPLKAYETYKKAWEENRHD